MNINGDRWRAGTGRRWMAFCSASDSSAPLMGSAWLDSIMSPDTLWRGCKLSIRPLSLHTSYFPIFCCCLHLIPCHHLVIIHLALTSHFPLPYSLLHISLASCFPLCSICREDTDMNFIQVERNEWSGKPCICTIHQFPVMWIVRRICRV